ncbi:MAG: hypothetical protein ABSC49_03055 [Candidatus Microgenomates bacterium]|jgi:hypothetical protein
MNPENHIGGNEKLSNEELMETAFSLFKDAERLLHGNNSFKDKVTNDFLNDPQRVQCLDRQGTVKFKTRHGEYELYLEKKDFGETLELKCETRDIVDQAFIELHYKKAFRRFGKLVKSQRVDSARLTYRSTDYFRGKRTDLLVNSHQAVEKIVALLETLDPDSYTS